MLLLLHKDYLFVHVAKHRKSPELGSPEVKGNCECPSFQPINTKTSHILEKRNFHIMPSVRQIESPKIIKSPSFAYARGDIRDSFLLCRFKHTRHNIIIIHTIM